VSLGSTTAKNADLDNNFGDAKGTAAPSTLYLAFFTDGTYATELTGTGGISRIAFANTGAASGTNWPSASGGSKSNGVAITSSTSSGAWSASATNVALMDAASGGNRFDQGALDSAISIPGSGYAIQFAVGALAVTAS
jgi:hypothetical protein